MNALLEKTTGTEKDIQSRKKTIHQDTIHHHIIQAPFATPRAAIAMTVNLPEAEENHGQATDTQTVLPTTAEERTWEN